MSTPETPTPPESQQAIITKAPSTAETQAFALLQRQATMLASSTLVPKDFQGNVANCCIGLEIANRLRASAFMVIQNIDIIHGRPSFRATFLIAMVNASGRFTPLQFRMEGDKANRSCVAHCKDATTGEVIEGPEVSMAMAKAEGWSTKNGSKWLTMPELMLRYRAAAFFARLYAPDITLGMQTAEELRDVEIDVTPPKRTAARAVPLNPFPQPAAIEAPKEAPAIDAETVANEGNPVFDNFLLSIGEVNTASDLTSYNDQCAEFENETERTIAKAAVNKQAQELGLKWDGAQFVAA
jgi:hypothetical protein